MGGTDELRTRYGYVCVRERRLVPQSTLGRHADRLRCGYVCPNLYEYRPVCRHHGSLSFIRRPPDSIAARPRAVVTHVSTCFVVKAVRAFDAFVSHRPLCTRTGVIRPPVVNTLIEYRRPLVVTYAVRFCRVHAHRRN